MYITFYANIRTYRYQVRQYVYNLQRHVQNLLRPARLIDHRSHNSIYYDIRYNTFIIGQVHHLSYSTILGHSLS